MLWPSIVAHYYLVTTITAVQRLRNNEKKKRLQLLGCSAKDNTERLKLLNFVLSCQLSATMNYNNVPSDSLVMEHGINRQLIIKQKQPVLPGKKHKDSNNALIFQNDESHVV